MNRKLLFVYNADSGPINAVKDYLEKKKSPANYRCKLCQVTYPNILKSKKWSKFINSLPVKSEFLHKNEFIKLYQNTIADFPVVILQKDSYLNTIISKEDFDKIKNLEDLIKLLSVKLENEK